jgi:hypothetical protein
MVDGAGRWWKCVLKSGDSGIALLLPTTRQRENPLANLEGGGPTSSAARRPACSSIPAPACADSEGASRRRGADSTPQRSSSSARQRGGVGGMPRSGDPCRSEFARTPALAGWPLDDLTPCPENLTCKIPLNRLTLRPLGWECLPVFSRGGFSMQVFDRRTTMQAADPGERVGEVPAVVARLECAIQELAQVTDQLGMRLSPVLSPSPGEHKAPDVQRPGCACDLAAKLDGFAGLVESRVMELRRLANHVEL